MIVHLLFIAITFSSLHINKAKREPPTHIAGCVLSGVHRDPFACNSGTMHAWIPLWTGISRFFWKVVKISKGIWEISPWTSVLSTDRRPRKASLCPTAGICIPPMTSPVTGGCRQMISPESSLLHLHHKDHGDLPRLVITSKWCELQNAAHSRHAAFNHGSFCCPHTLNPAGRFLKICSQAAAKIDFQVSHWIYGDVSSFPGSVTLDKLLKPL